METKSIKDKAKSMVKDVADSVKKKADETILDETFRKETADKIKGGTKKAAIKAKNAAVKTKDKTVELADKTKEELIKVLDKNGDGVVDIEDVIYAGLQVPGVRIDRTKFLEKEFSKYYSKEIIDKAIKETPAKAGIDQKTLDKIADSVIAYERVGVSGISAALGMPGGFAVIATTAADIGQYYSFMLRAIQKLLYLYGFGEINIKEKTTLLDSETMNMIILCLGVMYGVAGAKTGLVAISKGLACGVEKKLMNTALTKGTIYPIVKQVAKWFNVKMTKEVFAGFFKKSIPVVGGIIGGGLTFLSFKPCCDKLKDTLKDSYLNKAEIDKDAINDKDVQDMINDVEFKELIDDEDNSSEE